MRFPVTLLAPALLLILVGCEGSPYPLSKPGDAPIRTEWLGNWEAVDDDGERHLLQVFAFNQFEYLAILDSPEEEDDGMFRVYESSLDGLFFANIQCVGCDDDSGFLFGQVASDGRSLELRWVEDDFYETVADADGPGAVAAALTAFAEGEYLDDERWIWSRVER